MKTLLSVLAFVTLTGSLVFGQEPATTTATIVEQVEISGIPEQRLSQGLRDDLQQLEGKPYDAQAANQFADRIQTELPDHVAASRVMPGSQADRVRLVFAIARISDRDPLGDNINARYSVESVEVAGIPQSQVGDTLYAAMQKMVGQPLDNKEADRLKDQLAALLGSQYAVGRRVVRGEPQHLRMIYDAYPIPWLPYREPKSFLTYHPKQGMSMAIGMGIGIGKRTAFTSSEVSISATSSPTPGHGPGIEVSGDPGELFTRKIFVGIANSGDDLLERYKGFRFGYEQVRVGTDRLGVKFSFSSYGATWKSQTDLASQVSTAADALYRERRMLEPSVAFAYTPHLFSTVGLRIVDLDMQPPSTGSRSASAAAGGWFKEINLPDQHHPGASRSHLRLR